jgi:Ni/Co efflux regulator RcnB
LPILIAALSAGAVAQTQAGRIQAAAKPPSRRQGRPAGESRQGHRGGHAARGRRSQRQADRGRPGDRQAVYVGDIPCELGARVRIKPAKREGYFVVTHGINRFVMHPVESRTGAIRLEDPARGAMWLQLANKSMLMSQKEGKRLADECQSPSRSPSPRK